MEREIKLRVWDNVNYMSKPFTLTDLMRKRIEFTSNCVVMQFTGKHDKNNKEVYDGDFFREIIEFDEGDEIEYYIIVWIQEWCMFAALDSGEYLDYIQQGVSGLERVDYWEFHLERIHTKEILGNIYENRNKLRGYVFDLDEEITT